MFGFYARGSDGHLIIDNDNPVLCQKYTGKLIINQMPIRDRYGYTHPNGYGYGYCEAKYPSPVKSQMPPMVFAVPTAISNNKGLGYFQHRGGPGNWTGFSAVITNRLFAGEGPGVKIGFDSGWTYRVCVFGDPGVNRPGASNYGLNLFDSEGLPIFSSNWPVVPFRSVLSGWKLDSFTRSFYGGTMYWQNSDYDPGIKFDYVLAKGTHSWGGEDGKLGLLISSIGFVPVRADVGRRDLTVNCVTTLGFPDSRRDRIWSVTYYGLAQHPSANMSAISNWKILTADFSHLEA